MSKHPRGFARGSSASFLVMPEGVSLMQSSIFRNAQIEVDAKSCRIGIQVPPSVPVYRAEAYARLQAENKRVAAIQQPDLQAMAQLSRKREKASG